MKQAYSHNFEQVQEDEPLLLDLDWEIVSSAFWNKRQPEDRGKIAARNAVLFAYEQGSIGATEAFGYMVEKDLFGDVGFFMDAYAAGVRATGGRQ